MHKARRVPTLIEGAEAIIIASDRSFPRHAHDQYGIGRIYDGAQLSWSGRGQVAASAGDVMTANPNEVHDGIVAGGRQRTWRMIYLDPDAVAAHGADASIRDEISFPVKRCARLAAMVDRMLATVTDLSADPVEAREALSAVLDATLGAGLPEPCESGEISAPVRLVLERIHDRPGDPATLEEFAAISGLDRFQILRRFRSEMGITPYGYLTQYRVRVARRQLLCGAAISEAALSAGFSDQSHLTRVFSRQLGLPPGRYVKAIPV